jgi:hypothetical protein
LPSNRNRLLASLSNLNKHLREVPIKQGELLEERREQVDLVHFPQSGMISLIVEMPEDRAIEVDTVGSEGQSGSLSDWARIDPMGKLVINRPLRLHQRLPCQLCIRRTWLRQ